MQARALLTTLIALASALAPAPSAAHDNIIVHRRLGELSVQQLGHPFFFPYVSDVKEGSYGEDVPATRSLGHFYNPETNSAPWFAIGSGAAWENAETQFDAAIDQYLAGNYSGEDAAFYRMGRALHFIQDMTSPAHVHDDQHATDDEDFEDYGPSHVDDYDFSHVVPKFAANPTAEGFVKEIARVSYDMTRYQAVLDAYDGCPSQCQPNSQLRTMFPSLHYEDGGFFDGDVWEIDRIGRTDTFGGASDDWWLTDESKVEDGGGRNGSDRMLGDAYIENTGGNSAQPVPVVFNGQPNSSNETLLQLYARNLYPEAIAYGAGLLQVFANSVGAPPGPTSTGTPTSSPTATATPAPPATATDTPLVPNTATHTATPLATATRTARPALCPPAPRLDCRSGEVGRSRLLLKDRPGSASDRLLWRFTRGDVVAADLGNPFSIHSYAFCLYDDRGSGDELVLSAEARQGDTCAQGPCWRTIANGLRYDDKSASHDGLRQILLRGAPLGRGKILVKAQGANLALPAPTAGRLLSQTPRVRAQFLIDGGVCWESAFGAPALRNAADLFKDRND